MHFTYQVPIKMPVMWGWNNCVGMEEGRFHCFSRLFSPKARCEIIWVYKCYLISPAVRNNLSFTGTYSSSTYFHFTTAELFWQGESTKYSTIPKKLGRCEIIKTDCNYLQTVSTDNGFTKSVCERPVTFKDVLLIPSHDTITWYQFNTSSYVNDWKGLSASPKTMYSAYK